MKVCELFESYGSTGKTLIDYCAEEKLDTFFRLNIEEAKNVYPSNVSESRKTIQDAYDTINLIYQAVVHENENVGRLPRHLQHYRSILKRFDAGIYPFKNL